MYYLIVFVMALVPQVGSAESSPCLKKAVAEIIEEESANSLCEQDPELSSLKLTLNRASYSSYILTIKDCAGPLSEYSLMTENHPQQGCKIEHFRM